MDIIRILIGLIIGYLLGSIPFALILGKQFGGMDVRGYGSGNLGGTNVIRMLGPKIGIPVIFCDIAKGVIAAMVGVLLGGQTLGLLAGLLAVLGHLYPVFAGFKGGKGVATGAGVFLFLAPGPIMIAVSIFGVVLLLFGYVSLASIIAAAATIVLLALPGFLTGMEVDLAVRLGGIATSVFIIYKHRSNISKLMVGEEKKALYNKRKK